MSKPTLIYFDAPMSRGEECRLALHAAGVDFTDRRLKREDWASLKPSTPYGALPVLEVPGKPALAQSNAILGWIGREHGLLPADGFEAARHVAVMEAAEELRLTMGPSMRITDEAQKLVARTELATKTIPTWAGFVERQIGDGPFFGGSSISVADIKLYIMVRWLSGGALDHIPKDVLAPFPKLNRLYQAVADHPRIQSWLSRKN